jgi:mannose-6-phosphate isomerase-like protein (cupin superfamily)
MRIFVLGAAAVAVAVSFMIGRLSAQEFQPSCVLCPSTYIAADELAAYERIGRATRITDQQMRSIDIGKTNLQLALVHRGTLDAPAPRSVAEHDLVSEVYYVISGSGTNVTGPQMTGQERRPATDRAVRLLNGPGTNAQEIRNGTTHELEQGDVLVIPAGTGHQFTKIDDHITYLMIRIDPDKVVPLMDEAASRAYLQENRQ